MQMLLGAHWKTSLCSFAAGVLTYFAMVGTKFPETPHEWLATLWAAVLYAWGRVAADGSKA